ncbi:ArnT family glycosyltransferase [Tunturiibacter gelidoferens]|uniref:4-amino-4-deoxy-L-arabinose transferase-like glycosyltransferase n=1 Tax=Tunturiibacter gelidiferens TaxID=3069689 RepID=A0ACC5P4L4_9BACT|nr:glycosyltransferase family 39 protein [Edaphobacter lichenicola]MBB5341794.1 4-amino-4-deoxy-L-arabinose transferase-like glycosyltransferase [Edaphobacter lichenicola]
MLYPLFFVAVYLSHFRLLRLPYFWDEGGYYIPAAWDFFRTGTLIPQSTVTNAHPPLPSILLAGWWHLSGYVVSGTRTLVCMVAAAALLGVFKLAKTLTTAGVAAVTVVLTAIYPVWFAQSTLAHADIFAAAFSLWGLAFYFNREGAAETPSRLGLNTIYAAAMFSLAALSKETSIVTPAALALWEIVLLQKNRREPLSRRLHFRWIVALLAPILPLAAWYGYHYRRTGFVFGNPEFLRYNATANLDAYRIVLCLWHRFLHLFAHMNMFVPVVCTIAAMLIPVAATNSRPPISRPALKAIGVILLANWIAFSVLGGALLTRYLLPMYPLILLVCVNTWCRRIPERWPLLAALSAAAFLAGIWINPPYAFAPEDNLTYRDFIVLHQQAIRFIDLKYPQATVLTAWPAVSELNRPELGYTNHPIKTTPIQNFSLDQIQRAAADPGSYDVALLFSTKWAPPANRVNLGRQNESADTKYFDFHRDLSPAEVAILLHGEVVWQGHRKGEWAAVLHFPRIVEAALLPLQKPGDSYTVGKIHPPLPISPE